MRGLLRADAMTPHEGQSGLSPCAGNAASPAGSRGVTRLVIPQRGSGEPSATGHRGELPRATAVADGLPGCCGLRRGESGAGWRSRSTALCVTCTGAGAARMYAAVEATGWGSNADDVPCECTGGAPSCCSARWLDAT
jgi:hypothetical protein